MSNTYPLVKFHFQVQWGGTQIGFTEISGLDAEADLVEYRHGASPEFSKIKMPGLRKFSNITMKRGSFKNDNEYFAWYNSIKQNTVERRDVTISLLDEEGAAVITWKVRNAFPLKIQSTNLKADASEVAIESIEIAHEGLTIQNGNS